MTETSVLTAARTPADQRHAVVYGYGRSSLGGFLVAADKKGLCAVLFGDNHASLLDDLRAAFPDSAVSPSDNSVADGFVVSTVASLIEQPAASLGVPSSTRGGDFKQLVHAAVRATRPGTTITPEAVAMMIGAPAASAPYVRACAAEDLLAVAAPFHRLQEQDGTSPAYRWGEDRRQALLRREAAAWLG